jgi:hypothetical protein
VPAYIPPAGLTPAGAFVPQTFDDPKRPPGILADAIDYRTGEYMSILKGMDPIDEQVLIALTRKRGSGIAVMNDGQSFHEIEKVDDSTANRLAGEVARACGRLVESRDIRLKTVQPVVDQNNDYADVVVEFVNQRARTNRSRIARIDSRVPA